MLISLLNKLIFLKYRREEINDYCCQAFSAFFFIRSCFCGDALRSCFRFFQSFRYGVLSHKDTFSKIGIKNMVMIIQLQIYYDLAPVIQLIKMFILLYYILKKCKQKLKFKMLKCLHKPISLQRHFDCREAIP